MKIKVLVIMFIVSLVAVSSYALTVTDGSSSTWGKKPKSIVGDDGGKWLSWNLGNLKSGAGVALGLSDDSSVFYPNGDGTWSITLKYSPGYTVSEYKILYADTSVSSRADAKAASWDWGTQYQDNFGTSRSLAIPSTASGSYTVDVNWNDTPWALSSSNFKAQPDSGQIILYWSAQVNSGNGYADVDSAETGDNYGYKIYRADTVVGPFANTIADSNNVYDTYLNRFNVNGYGSYSSQVGGYGYKLVDDSAPIVNGTTYYYVIIATDAYGVASDTNVITGVPADWINVIFTVEGIDWNKVSTKFNYTVYLTPWLNGKPYFNHKIPAKIAAAYVPKS